MKNNSLLSIYPISGGRGEALLSSCTCLYCQAFKVQEAGNTTLGEIPTFYRTADMCLYACMYVYVCMYVCVCMYAQVKMSCKIL